jgi:hypothetical protein
MQEDEQFEEARLSYRLTHQQEDAFNALVRAADDIMDRTEEADDRTDRTEESGRLENEEEDLMLKRINQLCLELCMTLLNHELSDDEYESVIISGLAVLGFWDDRGWLNAEDYTIKYSGFIKIARMLVIYRSYMEWEARYEMN